MAHAKGIFCLYLRTKSAYFRTVDGKRMFEPNDPTACYTCLKTQRPVGPDGRPCDAHSCGNERGCYEQDR